MGAIDYASIQSDAREIRMDRIALLYAEIIAATRAFLGQIQEAPTPHIAHGQNASIKCVIHSVWEPYMQCSPARSA